MLGLDDPAKIAAARDSEGKAVGSACRHSGRALEDCYVKNPKAQKASVFAGWRDMDSYMRDNKIDVVVPDLVDAPTHGSDKAGVDEPPKATEHAPDKKATAKH